VHWGTAWEWTLVQGLIQSINELYLAFGSNPRTVSCYVSAIPGQGALSLRLYDNEYHFWIQATLVRCGPDDQLTLQDMIDDGASVVREDGTHVAARIVGVLDLTQTDVLHAFDVAHVEAALQGTSFADMPSIRTLPNPTGLNAFREVLGTQSDKLLGPEGSSYVRAVTDTVAVVTVGAPALQMPGTTDNWSALDPVAVLALMHGASAA